MLDHQRSLDPRPFLGKLVTYTGLGLFTLLTIVPLVWLLYSSLKTNGEIMRNALALPETPYWANYTRAWELGNLGTYFFNSVLYTGIGTLGTVVLSLSTGYGIASFGYKIGKVFSGLLLAGILISVHSVLVPLFILESKVGLINTRLGILLPYIAFGLPMGVLLASAFIRNIPAAIQESAQIDGATWLQIFVRIILPFSQPVLATIAILTFLQNWNEFVFVFILSSSEAMKSLPVGINSFAGSLNTDFGMQFAGLVIGTVPVLIFYTLFHKQLAQGFAEGGVKE